MLKTLRAVVRFIVNTFRSMWGTSDHDHDMKTESAHDLAQTSTSLIDREGRLTEHGRTRALSFDYSSDSPEHDSNQVFSPLARTDVESQY